MQLTPVIAIHMSAALGALVIGPVALWARRARSQRPKLHRAFGYAWVTLMVATAVSAMFIRDFAMPNLAGYTPIHLLVPATLAGLFGAFWHLARGNVAGHRRLMQVVYVSACIVAGAFTLLPRRYLGQLVFGQCWDWPDPPFHPVDERTSMLLQIITHNPQMLGIIVRSTPVWVWGLLAGLVALGLSQARDRSASLARTAIMPVAMTAFSLWGTLSAFGRAPQLAGVLGVWFAAAAMVFALVARIPAHGRYDAASRTFTLPGSLVPLVLILGIFLTRYVVNVELALAPRLARDTQFTLACAAVYGALTGIFAGRAAGLWRLAFFQTRPAVAAAVPAR